MRTTVSTCVRQIRRRAPALRASWKPSTRMLYGSPARLQQESDTPDLTGPTEAAVAAASSNWRGIPRFYNTVGVRRAAGPPEVPFATPILAAGREGEPLWEVLIEGRALRTHAMNELLLPSEALAYAIAAEFAAQGAVILPATTPLYALACAALDTFAHEDLAAAEDAEADARARRLAMFDQALGERTGTQGSSSSSEETDAFVSSGAAAAAATGIGGGGPLSARESAGLSSSASAGTPKLRDLLLDFLETDTVCYRLDWDGADPAERSLRKRQDRYYNPLVAWFNDSFGVSLGITFGLGEARHPEDAYVAAEDAVDTADPFLKAALQAAVGSLKSSVLALAFVHGKVDAGTAFDAARVEEEWQIGENGFVEDGHDTSRAGLRATLTSISAFMAALPASAPGVLPSKSDVAGVEAARASRAARVGARHAREAALVREKREALRRAAAADAEEERAMKAARHAQQRQL